MEYKIPEEILDKIPERFWPAFAGDLVSVFGPDVLAEDEDGCYTLYFRCGTMGWNAALSAALRKLDMMWLYDYYDKLEWWESDHFDGEVADLLIAKFIKAEDKPWNTYYRYLIGAEIHDDKS